MQSQKAKCYIEKKKKLQGGSLEKVLAANHDLSLIPGILEEEGNN